MIKLTWENLIEALAAEFGPADEFDLLDQARNEDAGLCVECKTVAYGCEPDMRRGRCENCGAQAVFGIEELAIRLIP